jgi:hypothetical protein
MTRKSLSGLALKAPFLDVYHQEGENTAYVPAGNGTNITVNAAQNKLLAWQYTPPVDVWAEFYFAALLMQKTDAAYHYCYLQLLVQPTTGVIGPSTIQGPLITQHSQVQQFEGYQCTALWGLAAGTAYTMRANWAISGGTWQYYQDQSYLRCIGKAWAR